MKYLTIDVQFSNAYGLDANHTIFFAYLRSSSSWANDCMIKGKVWKWLTSNKVTYDLKFMGLNASDVVSMFKGLKEIGLIDYSVYFGKEYFIILDKGKSWNSNKYKNSYKAEPSRNKTFIATEIIENEIQEQPQEEEKVGVMTFDDFWKKYGKRKAKFDAMKAWAKLSSSDIEHIYKIIDQYIKDTPEIKFRPYAATFLNSKRWLDYDSTDVKATSETNSESKEQRYNTLLERIKQNPFDENRFTIDERRFMILYQSETDRFPPDDRKMISEMTSLTKEEQNIKDAQRWTI